MTGIDEATNQQLEDVARYVSAIADVGAGADIQIFITALIYSIAGIVKLHYREDEQRITDNACDMLRMLVDEGQLVENRIQ